MQADHPSMLCPECHAPGLQPINVGGRVNFLCAWCERCWHVELGRMSRVSPATCGLCANAPACEEQWRRDHAASEAELMWTS